MKHIITTILLLLVFGAHAQDQSKCEEIVKITAEAISAKASSQIEPYLAADFTIADQTGEIAKMVLKQLLSQLNDQVTDYSFASKEQSTGLLQLRYNFTYAQLGEKQAIFKFNAENKLVELSLFEMEVKTMNAHPEVQQSEANVIEIPFTQKGNLISVKVNLDGVERDFLLDSGSPTLVLNSKYIEGEEGDEEDDKHTKLSTSQGVNGAISMDIVKVQNIDFSGIRLSEQEVVAIDLSHLEAELETEVYGLIGYDMIKDFDVLFDYEAGTVTLIKPAHFPLYREKYLANYSSRSVKLKMEAHIPVIEMEVGKNKLAMGIDCGAETNLIDDDYTSVLKRHSKDCGTDQLIGAGGGNATEISICSLKEASIARKNFLDMETVFSDISHLNQGYSINLAGLIGYQVLARQKTLLSFAREELVFMDL